MHELLGLVLGVAIGSALPTIQRPLPRAAAFPPALMAAGALTAAVNGELGSGLAAAFVAIDTALAALGVALGATLVGLGLRVRARP